MDVALAQRAGQRVVRGARRVGVDADQAVGRVQGVAYRDTCQRLATEHGVTGWVRNEPGGSVVLHAPDGVTRPRGNNEPQVIAPAFLHVRRQPERSRHVVDGVAGRAVEGIALHGLAAPLGQAADREAPADMRRIVERAIGAVVDV